MKIDRKLCFVAAFAIASAGVTSPAVAAPEDLMAHLTAGSDRTPVVKEFDAAWVRTLTRRGEPLVFTRANSEDFKYIGMPVGGVCAGQLYLGGDGKLWFWDIFNTNDRHGTIRGEQSYEFPSPTDPLRTEADPRLPPPSRGHCSGRSTS
jgi:hypothetical protein